MNTVKATTVKAVARKRVFTTHLYNEFWEILYMLEQSIFSIVDIKDFCWGEIIEIKSKKAGRHDLRLIYKIDENEEGEEVEEKLAEASSFNFASISPYFDIIIETMRDVSEYFIRIKNNPFDKEAREKLNNETLLNHPPYKKTLKLDFKEDNSTNKIIWFCCADKIRTDSRIRLAPVEFDPDQEDEKWRIVE